MPKPPPQWHPMLATTEPEPGVWILLDSMRRPYGRITIIRNLGRIRFRAEYLGTLLGYSSSLRTACERVHGIELQNMNPRTNEDAEALRQRRAEWINKITTEYRR